MAVFSNRTIVFLLRIKNPRQGLKDTFTTVDFESLSCRVSLVDVQKQEVRGPNQND
jgi:hypothetical protein